MGSEAEVWKPIKGYEGFYEVSTHGRVRSVERIVRGRNNSARIIKSKIKAQRINTAGYLSVNLNKGNVYKTFRVHRLMAEAFIQNPNNLPIINHIDGNKLNNTIANLEWCDYSYNALHAHRTGLTSNRKPIKNVETGEVFYSESEAARAVNGLQGNIGRTVRDNANGKWKTAYGYHWIFAD